MPADVSRVRFDPARDYTAVVAQQGRVQLDADGNEQAALTDRRARAASADLGSPGLQTGIRGTAVCPRTTPDGFKITGGAPDPQIGVGRMYVDGILVENHGTTTTTGTTSFDPLLAERFGPVAAAYSKQPWFQPGPTAPTSGTHLVYLDVWEREVTHVERSDLVEVAVAVDTTARRQVVWQVRVHAPDTPGITATTPDSAIPGWAAVVAPSASRLRVDKATVSASLSPCEMPPTGDYRGLENQTYRVEIHEGGAPGTATFTWSRDNASIAFPVQEVLSATEFRLPNLGRDDVLALHDGTWVEFQDDRQELAGAPGVLRQVTVDPDRRSIAVSPALPAGWPATTAEATARHLRVRRWDTPTSTGTVTVPASGAAVALENGITVALTCPGGSFRVGEHWIFAARTGDSSVEMLADAPPLGPHHHIARLGVLVNGKPTDWRTLWPPLPVAAVEDECCCTVCVTPEQHASGELTLQDAVDRVTDDGGTICLAVGTYTLAEPLRMAKLHAVTLRGHGLATTVTAPGDVVQVTGCTDVALTGLYLASAGERESYPAAVVRAWDTQQLVVRDCGLTMPDDEGRTGTAVALHNVATGTRILDNLVQAPIGVLGPDDLEEGEVLLMLDDVEVVRNRLTTSEAGVDLGLRSLALSKVCIADNIVERPGRVGIRAPGTVGNGAEVRISGNHVDTQDDGIVVGRGGAAVTDNVVVFVGYDQEKTDATGIGSDPEATSLGVGPPTRIESNAVEGFTGAGVALRDQGDAVVVGNTISSCASGLTVAGLDARRLRVAGNTVDGSTGARRGLGIGVGHAAACSVTDNLVRALGAGEGTTHGIVVVDCGEATVHGNTVADLTEESEGSSVDFLVTGCDGVVFSDNVSQRTDPEAIPDRAFGLAVSQLLSRERVMGTSATIARGWRLSADKGSSDRSEGPRAVVTGNQLRAGRLGSALVVQAAETVVADNWCRQQYGDSEDACVHLQAARAVVSANRVLAGGGQPAIAIACHESEATILGNLTSGHIETADGPLTRWADVNTDGVF